ncbi:MAG: DUF4982 domain-containing protein [Bacteroidaceae bacterium]|nr:DUF4982 domain-containing protein [Bacteroidaceae bacterium]
MKYQRIFLVISILSCALTAMAQVGFGQAEKFNTDWLFVLQDKAAMVTPDYDDSGWRRLDVPHDWSVEGQMSEKLFSCTGYLPGGIAWYRKHFKVNTSTSQLVNSLTYIYFEGVYNRSEVYLNGHLLGKRPSGFASFLYDMTPYLREGDNVLAVRVDHSRQADSRWYTGSGIYRNVWLIHAPKTHLAQWGTAYRLTSIDNDKAIIEVDVATEGESTGNLTVEVLLVDNDGKTVAKANAPVTVPEKKTVTMTVTQPHRWNLDTPYLYTLRVLLKKDGKETDRDEVKAGLRTLTFNADHGFALNGQWMKVKGVCLHDDAGVLGVAVPKEVWHRRLLELKALGVNAIRMSHNPHAPMLYDLCDEVGLLVMDEASDEWEFPKRKWLEGWNKGKPGYEGTFDYFEEWIERDVADMVRRDRNHPSIFLWSIGNEVDYPNDPYSHPVLNGDNSMTQPIYGGYKPEQPNAERIGLIAQRLAKVVRDIDNSRAVTGALAGVVMSNETAYPEAVDVVGYNYTESRYQEDHQKYPQRVIYGSENRHDMPAWQAVRDNEHIFGQFLWTGIDYLGESGPWPARGSTAGLLDFAGFRKARGWFRAALWSEQPVCYIGTIPMRDRQRPRQGNHQEPVRQRRQFLSSDAPAYWNYQEGQNVRVFCYTNSPQARLLLNGQQVGETKQRDDQTGIIYWDIPYTKGILRAEGCNEQGTCLADYEIRTFSEATALRLTLDNSVSSEQLAQVLVEVVDAQGNVVTEGQHEVRCEVIDGAFLGMENGDVRDISSAKSTKRHTTRGRLLSYISRKPSADGTNSPVLVRFTATGLPSAEITLWK